MKIDFEEWYDLMCDYLKQLCNENLIEYKEPDRDTARSDHKEETLPEDSAHLFICDWLS